MSHKFYLIFFLLNIPFQKVSLRILQFKNRFSYYILLIQPATVYLKFVVDFCIEAKQYNSHLHGQRNDLYMKLTLRALRYFLSITEKVNICNFLCSKFCMVYLLLSVCTRKEQINHHKNAPHIDLLALFCFK